MADENRIMVEGESPNTIKSLEAGTESSNVLKQQAGQPPSFVEDTALDRETTNPQEVMSEVKLNEKLTVQPSSSLVLGDDGSNISSGARVLLFTDARGRDTALVHYRLDENGSEKPYYWLATGVPFSAPVTTATGTQLSSPQDFAFPAVGGDTRTVAFEIIPLTSGTLRVQSWEGSDDTGAVLVDNYFDIPDASVYSIGNPFRIEIPNPLITELGDSQYTRFSGIELEGGLNAGGIFDGEVKPFLTSEIQIVQKKDLLDSDDALDYVKSVNGGFLIGVDNSDPENPVVNFGFGATTQQAPDSIDLVLLFNASDGTPYNTTIRDIISMAVMDAFTSGTLANFTITTTPTPLPIFTNNFYSSSSVLIKSLDDTGLTTLAGLRWDVHVGLTLRTAGNDDFFCQIYSGGSPVGEVQDVSGDSIGKAISTSLEAFTDLMSPNEKIELRVWVDSGTEEVTNIIGTMKSRFAGAT